ncbi:MAG: DUF397 domain-containing protein [Actinomycetota bacterium]|nr:DUF397 domain-containing protein [Actinomycetota bacterium]
MSEPHGVSVADLGPVVWRRSSAGSPTGECVEFAVLDSGDVAVRNSRNPHGPVLVYTPAEISAFVHGVKAGEFDDMVS